MVSMPRRARPATQSGGRNVRRSAKSAQRPQSDGARDILDHVVLQRYECSANIADPIAVGVIWLSDAMIVEPTPRRLNPEPERKLPDALTKAWSVKVDAVTNMPLPDDAMMLPVAAIRRFR